MANADRYLSTQVMTASPYQLHLIVVEGSIQFAELGIEALQAEDIETSHLALSQCRDFVAEMIGGLKEDCDPELTNPVKQLFFFAYTNLVEGERDRDVNKVKNALTVLKLHHETWIELGAQLKSSAPGASAGPTISGTSRAWSA